MRPSVTRNRLTPEQRAKRTAGNHGGGGRPRKDDPTAHQKVQPKIRKLTQTLLQRPEFVKSLTAKLDDCTLHPSVLITLMYFAWGKPKDVIETTPAVPVRVQHIFAGLPEPAE